MSEVVADAHMKEVEENKKEETKVEDKKEEKKSEEKKEEEDKSEDKEEKKDESPSKRKRGDGDEKDEEDDGKEKEEKTPKAKRTRTPVKPAPESFEPTSMTRSGREVKKIERFVSDAGSKEKIAFTIESGKGVRLGDIEAVNEEISKRNAADKVLRDFHRVLFHRPGEARKVKSNIREFSGFVFSNEEEEREMIQGRFDKWTSSELKDLCTILHLEKGGTKNDLLDRIMGFLDKPQDSKPKSKRAAAKDSSDEEEEKSPKKAKETPKKEAAKKETPKKESPKKETPKKEAAKKETPKKETPKKEAAKKESPKKEAAKKETPKKESPKKESPKKESPKKETPKKKTTKKDEASEEIPDEKIVEKIDEIMASQDLSKITKKSIRTSLEEHFGNGISSKKKLIDERIAEVLEDMKKKDNKKEDKEEKEAEKKEKKDEEKKDEEKKDEEKKDEEKKDS